MSARDYPITFPYGATSAPYTKTSPHRGDDRACPTGTPVVCDGQTIGLTGATGRATGPHLHIQEWQGTPANTRKPQNSFKGGVVTASTSSSDFGNYITITKDGWNTSYAHLSKNNVQVGQVIGDEVITKDDTGLLRIGHSEIGGWDLNKTHAGEYDSIFHAAWDGKPVKDFIWAQWNNGGAYRTAKVAQAKAIQDLQNTVNNLSARPTKEELQKALDNVAQANAKVAEAEKARDEAIAKQTADTQLLDEGKGVFAWITKLIERLKR